MSECNDPSEHLPYVMLMLVVSVAIVFIILIISRALTGTDGIPEDEDPKVLLQGVFSFQSLIDKSLYVAVNPTDTNNKMILSNSALIPCNSYRWVYNQSDQTLEWGGNPFPVLDNEKLVATVDFNIGTNIVLKPKGTANSPNQWVFNTNNSTWCLKSNPSLCMNSTGNILTLETLVFGDTGFFWGITKDLVPPACA